MTSVFGGPQTVNQNQSTNQAISQATQQQAQSANAQAQQTQANPLAMSVGRDISKQLLPSIADTPGNVPLLNVLPMNALSQQAISQMSGAANTLDPLTALGSGYLQQGAGYMNQGAGYFPQAQGYIGQGAGLMGQSGQVITPQDINAFYNPMAANVTAQMQNIFGQQNLANRMGATAASGGIGGDRAAVAQGILANQQGLAAGQTYSQLYQQALQAAEQQKAQQLASGQGLVGAGGATAGLGTGLAGIGGALGGLGLSGIGAAQNAYQQALMGGTQYQNQLQAAQNAAYQQQLGLYQDPYMRLQAATGAMPGLAALGQTGIQGGLAGTQQTGTLTGTQLGTGIGATTYPAPAILPQIAGLGSVGLGVAGLSGLFGASDRKAKTDIQRHGTDSRTGLPLYAYRYKGDPKTYPKVVGPMAQDVKKAYPEAVQQFGDKLAIKKFQSGGGVSGTIPASLLNNFPSLLNKAVGLQPQLTGLVSGLSGLSIPSISTTAAPASTDTGTTTVNTSGIVGGGTTPQYSWAPGRPVDANTSALLAAQPASFWAGVDPQNMGMGRSNFGSAGAKRGGRVYQNGGPVSVTETDNDTTEPDDDTDDTSTSKVDFTKYAKGVNLLNQYAKSATPKTPQAQPIKMPDTPWHLGQMPAVAAMSMQRGGDTDDSGSKTVQSADPDLAALRFEQTANLVQGHEVPPFQKGFAKGGPVKGYANAGPVDDSEDDGEHEPAGLPEDTGDDSEDTTDTVPMPLPRPQRAGFGQGRQMLPSPGGERMLPGPGGGMSGLGGMAQSPYMALMQAGLGMLAASGQRDARGLPMSPLGAIGAGGMAGMNTLQQQQAMAMKQKQLDESMAFRREQLNALEQHRQALENTARERLAIARGETGKPITLQTPYGPKSVIRQPDGTLIDAYSGRAVGQQTAIPSTATPTAGAFDSGPLAPLETDDQKAVVAGLAGRQQNDEPLFKTPQRSNPEFLDMLDSMQTSPQQFDFMAARLANGDTSVLTGTRGRAGAAIFANALKARAQDYWIDKGLGPKEANMAMVELGAKKAGARAIETRTGNITSALGRAAETAKVVTALSDKVNRTEYPDLNRLILSAKRRTGDEDTIRYGLAMETFIKNYAAATSQGSTVLSDHQYKMMADRLNEAWSKGQVRSVIDQGLIEINRELKGSHNALDMYLGRGAEPEGLEETAPAGGIKPTPTQKDLDYIKANPEKRQLFIKRFGIEPP